MRPLDAFLSLLAELMSTPMKPLMKPLRLRLLCREFLRVALWCWVIFHDGFDLLLVSLAISLEEVVCICLRW